MARAGAFACFALSCLLGCDGAVVNLGNSERLIGGGESGSAGSAGSQSGSGSSGGGPEWIRSDEPVLDDPDPQVTIASPALPEHMEYLLFTRQSRGLPDAHVWKARAAGDGFVLPDFKNDQPLALGEDPTLGASSPALSASGSELWFGMTAPDSLSGTDVYLALGEGGAWGVPQYVPELSTDFEDSPRPPGFNGTIMPLSRKRRGDPFFQIYFAYRDAVGASWGEPNQLYLENVNIAGITSVDGFLTNDGLTLYFASGAKPDATDLFRARRNAVGEAFGAPEPLDELNTGNDERDPWLSPGGEWLYYSSNRITGVHAIYRARRAVP